MTWLDSTAQAATALGFIAAIVAYFVEARRSRRQHAIDRFFQLNDQYREWLIHYIEHPEHQSILPHAPRASHLSADHRTKVALIELKLCELESAFYLYRRHRMAFDKAQWSGWNEQIRDWARLADFRDEWKAGIGEEYDSEFRKHVQEAVDEFEQKPK